MRPPSRLFKDIQVEIDADGRPVARNVDLPGGRFESDRKTFRTLSESEGAHRIFRARRHLVDKEISEGIDARRPDRIFRHLALKRDDDRRKQNPLEDVRGVNAPGDILRSSAAEDVNCEAQQYENCQPEKPAHRFVVDLS